MLHGERRYWRTQAGRESGGGPNRGRACWSGGGSGTSTPRARQGGGGERNGTAELGAVGRGRRSSDPSGDLIATKQKGRDSLIVGWRSKKPGAGPDAAYKAVLEKRGNESSGRQKSQRRWHQKREGGGGGGGCTTDRLFRSGECKPISKVESPTGEKGRSEHSDSCNSESPDSEKGESRLRYTTPSPLLALIRTSQKAR